MRAAVLTAAVACAALAACTTIPDRVIGENWVGTGAPTAIYPVKAMASRIEGWAVIRCLVQRDRRMTPCEVVKETPVGWGFGAAAVKARTGLILTSHPVPPGETAAFPVFFCLDPYGACAASAARFQAAVDRKRATGEGEVPTEPDWPP